MTSLLRLLYYRAFRWQLRLRLRIADYASDKATQVVPPLPPALLRYRVSESLSISDFLLVGKACAAHISTQLEVMGTSFQDCDHVLDFGCGCGRTLRWLTKDNPTTQFYGSDVDADAIRWCRQNMSQAEFAVNERDPPLRFETNFFDVVYCFSVFTHLNENAQDAWLAELRRVLKPGGILIVTVHNQRAASALDKQGSALLTRYGFVHTRSRKLTGIVPEWYNTTWHSPAYITSRLETLFTDVRYTVIPEGLQDVVSARVP